MSANVTGQLPVWPVTRVRLGVATQTLITTGKCHTRYVFTLNSITHYKYDRKTVNLLIEYIRKVSASIRPSGYIYCLIENPGCGCGAAGKVGSLACWVLGEGDGLRCM